jgi:hypothetical protein
MRASFRIPPAITRAAIAILSSWTLYSSVAGLTPHRIQLLANPATPAPSAVVSLADADRIPGSLVVLICRLSNPTRSRIDVEARIGAERLKDVQLEPSDRTRVDLVWTKPPAPIRGDLELIGGAPGWSLESIELANVHGFSRGLLNFVVVPAGARVETIDAWIWLAVTAALVLLFVSCSILRAAPVFRWWLAVPGLTMATLFVAAELLRRLTPYRVIWAPRTFVLALLFLIGPYACALVAAWVGRRPSTRLRSGPLAIAIGGAAGFCFFASAAWQTLPDYDGNYSGFLHLTTAVAQRAPFLIERPDLVRRLILYQEGYDGQFMYLMAFDPLLRRFKNSPERYREVVDLPPYRFGRIGFSLLTRAVSFGNPEQFPATMIWLALAGHLGIGLLLAAICVDCGAPPALGLLHLALPGLMPSLLFALPEALSVLGLLAGVVLVRRHRWLPAALCLAASLLVRETGLILAAAILVGLPSKHRVPAAILALVPLALWRGYVGYQLFPDFHWTGVFVSPGAFTVPPAGVAQLWSAVFSGTHASSEIAAALSLPLLLAAGAALSVTAAASTGAPLALAAAAYALMSACFNYERVWTHVPSAERAMLELFVCLLLLLISSSWSRTAWSRPFAIFFAAVAVYSFAFSPEAAASRAALLVIR